MSEDDDFEARARRLDARGRRALLDDLESIRTLLGDGATDAEAADAIPVLREIVQGPEAPPPAQAEPPPAEAGTAATPGEQQGDLFDPRAFADRLLDGDWAEERERILSDARAGVDAFSLGLDEASRLEREARLREAVTTRLAPRMEQVLGEAVDELRDNMLRVIRRELDALVSDVFGEPRNAGQNDD